MVRLEAAREIESAATLPTVEETPVIQLAGASHPPSVHGRRRPSERGADPPPSSAPPSVPGPVGPKALLLAGIVLLGGCASADPGRAPPVEEVRAESRGRSTVGLEGVRIWRSDVSVNVILEAPAEEVRRAVPAVYRALEIPVAVLDRDRGLVGTPDWQARRVLGERPDRHFRCGSGNSLTSHAASYAHVISVRTAVRPLDDGRTRLETRARATARPRSVSGNEVSCTSRQRLEKAINGAVIGALEREKEGGRGG